MAWNALDIATKAKLSPLFHSDVFRFSSPFSSDSPLSFRQQHVPPLFYHPPALWAQLTGLLFFQSVLSVLSLPLLQVWHHTGAGSRAQSQGVGGIFHSSAGITFLERVSPLAGLPTGGEKSFLTLSNDMNTFHYTRFTAAHSFQDIPMFSCEHVGTSFETVSDTKNVLIFLPLKSELQNINVKIS